MAHQSTGKDADTFDSLPALLWQVAKEVPDDIAYTQAEVRVRENAGVGQAEVDTAQKEWNASTDLGSSEIGPQDSAHWRDVPYLELQQRVENVAAGLAAFGVERGVRVGILSNTRSEWLEAELGSMAAGGTVVTCYTSDPATRIGYVLWDSNSKVAFVENQEQADKLVSLMRDPFAVPETEHAPAGIVRLELDQVIHFEAVSVPDDVKDKFMSFDSLQSGRFAEAESYRAALQDQNHVAASDDEATVIYTSGTTGAPKGVIATHRQHLSNVRQMIRSGIIDKVKKSFQLLPLAHGFGLQLLHTLVAHQGKAVFPRVVDPQSSALTDSVRQAIRTDMRDGKPEIIALVPKVLDGMKAKILGETRKLTPKGLLLKAVVHTYTTKFTAEQEAEQVPRSVQFMHDLLESKALGGLGPYVKQQLKAQVVGDDFKFFISGGAPLSLELYDFFGALDLPVYEGYGSTEANVPVTVNRPGKCRRGSVGLPLDVDNVLELTEEGELLISGPNVAREYNNRPGSSRKTWDEAHRLHTNDRADIDEDGYVYIRGRVDDLIVLSNGKNIEPEPIEEMVKQHPLVKDVVVVGAGRDSLTALIILDEGAVRRDAGDQEGSAASVYRSQDEERIKTSILSHVNSQIEKRTERLTDLAFVPEPEVGDGYTATMKLQKKKMAEKHREQIDMMYSSVRPGRKLLRPSRRDQSQAASKGGSRA